jgi:hypothetical protein
MSENMMPSVDFDEAEVHGKPDKATVSDKKLRDGVYVEMEFGALNSAVFPDGSMAINFNPRLVSQKGELVNGIYPRYSLNLFKSSGDTSLTPKEIKQRRDAFYMLFRTLDTEFPAKARWSNGSWTNQVTGETLDQATAEAMNAEIESMVAAKTKKLWEQLRNNVTTKDTDKGPMLFGERIDVEGITGTRFFTYVKYGKTGSGPYFTPKRQEQLPESATISYGDDAVE